MKNKKRYMKTEDTNPSWYSAPGVVKRQPIMPTQSPFKVAIRKKMKANED